LLKTKAELDVSIAVSSVERYWTIDIPLPFHRS